MGEAVPYFKPAAFLHVGIRNPLGSLTPPVGEDKTGKQAAAAIRWWSSRAWGLAAAQSVSQRDSLSVRERGRGGGRACIMHRTCPRCHVHICRCMRSHEWGPFPSLPAAKDFASSYFVFKGMGRSLAAALFLQLRHSTTFGIPPPTRGGTYCNCVSSVTGKHCGRSEDENSIAMLDYDDIFI